MRTPTLRMALACLAGFASGAASAGDFVLHYESVAWTRPSEPRQIRERLTGAEYLDLNPSWRNPNEGQLRVKIDGLFNDLFIHDQDGSHESELKCLERALQAGQVHALEVRSAELGPWANHRGQVSLDKVKLRLNAAPEAELARDGRNVPKVCEALEALRATQVVEESGPADEH